MIGIQLLMIKTIFLKVQSQSLRLKPQFKMVELWFAFHNDRLQWKIPELDEGFKLGNLH